MDRRTLIAAALLLALAGLARAQTPAPAAPRLRARPDQLPAPHARKHRRRRRPAFPRGAGRDEGRLGPVRADRSQTDQPPEPRRNGLPGRPARRRPQRPGDSIPTRWKALRRQQRRPVRLHQARRVTTSRCRPAPRLRRRLDPAGGHEDRQGGHPLRPACDGKRLVASTTWCSTATAACGSATSARHPGRRRASTTPCPTARASSQVEGRHERPRTASACRRTASSCTSARAASCSPSTSRDRASWAPAPPTPTPSTRPCATAPRPTA